MRNEIRTPNRSVMIRELRPGSARDDEAVQSVHEEGDPAHPLDHLEGVLPEHVVRHQMGLEPARAHALGHPQSTSSAVVPQGLSWGPRAALVAQNAPRARHPRRCLVEASMTDSTWS